MKWFYILDPLMAEFDLLVELINIVAKSSKGLI